MLVSQIVLSVVFLVWAAAGMDTGNLEPDAVVTAMFERMETLVTTGPGMLVALIFQWAVFVGVPFWAAKRKGLGSLSADFGFRFRRFDPILGLGIAVGMQALLYGAQKALMALGVSFHGSDNTGMVTSQAGVWLLVMALGAAVAAPIGEEIFFRGLLLRALLRRFAKVDLAAAGPATERFTAGRRRAGVIASVLVSAAIFGILHTPFTTGGQEAPLSGTIALAMMTGSLGAVFAVVAVRAGRIGPTVCAHIAFNSISLILTIAGS